MKNYMDFMMVLSPSESIKASVLEHKQYAAKTIGNYESMHSIAHISIKNLSRQKTFLTEPVILSLNKKLALMPPITLTIDGFDYFNHGGDFKTIYARIKSTPLNTTWFKELKKHLNLKEFLVPHITIVRNIPVAEFNQIWPYFKSIKWEEAFTINTLTVLQRETFASFANWEIFTELPFEGKIPYSAAQPKPHSLNPAKPITHKGQQISLFQQDY